MSIFLSNFVQVTQGPRNKSIPPMVQGDFDALHEKRLSGHAFRQAAYHLDRYRSAARLFLVSRHKNSGLAARQRACEQDQEMAALVGVDVDRTISMTFRHRGGARCRRRHDVFDVLWRREFRRWLCPGVKALPPPPCLGGIGSLPGAVIAGGILIGLIETMWSAYFSIDYKDVAAFSVLAITPIFLAARSVWPPGCRESLTWRAARQPSASTRLAPLRDAGVTALLTFGLFYRLIGFQDGYRCPQ